MSLAHGYPRVNRATEGSAAYALPAEPARHPETRTAAKPKARRRSRKPLALAAVGWACVMAFAMLVVHRNSLVLAETSAVTTARAQLAELQNQNQELEDKLTAETSVEAVMAWASAHGMTLAADVRTLEGVPTAVAAAEAPSAAAETPEEAPAGFWAALKARLTGTAAAP